MGGGSQRLANGTIFAFTSIVASDCVAAASSTSNEQRESETTTTSAGWKAPRSIGCAGKNHRSTLSLDGPHCYVQFFVDQDGSLSVDLDTVTGLWAFAEVEM